MYPTSCRDETLGKVLLLHNLITYVGLTIPRFSHRPCEITPLVWWELSFCWPVYVGSMADLGDLLQVPLSMLPTREVFYDNSASFLSISSSVSCTP